MVFEEPGVAAAAFARGFRSHFGRPEEELPQESEDMAAAAGACTAGVVRMKRAIIFGSSGFVGSHLLRELLNSPDYGEVIAVVRNDRGMSHPKLKTLLGDYNSVRALGTAVSGDEIFICLGTTRKASPNKGDYYRVDHDYPLLAAQLAKANGASSVFLVSAVGANPNSRFFYVKTKGETERDIARLSFKHAHFFRPSMITGQREKRRNGNSDDPALEPDQPVPAWESRPVWGYDRTGDCPGNEECGEESVRAGKDLPLERDERSTGCIAHRGL